ncbi:hypothetical protein LTR10_024233 [Elasticomyces elasticus]|uniref:Uncharacterized protein n=1 Tax=Exophiala sideris TaxID=1016849 RepID=A0ABR0IXX9_9EURO|nr:hypothetical protein LTR10_024233 [Elasticomyces elasticus]KAK5022367.1 hypothetical protein LTS07_010027 [Exophiala sideris]KAK5027275.1 hypothetical protein LTR13_009670 [Exophiala sideris]KAK5051221.1 hypothetical protein LTR69_010247 [Exophiala sideris]KAK5177815.1 hypothetical protein LTR44_009790 [Eurotiomycetes sp. CCFEE 6388]
MATKKVFVASVFKFTDFGAEQLNARFKDAHDDPDNAPFITFEKSSQTFSTETDQTDKDTIYELLSQMSGYIDYNVGRKLAFDDETCIVPMEGTLLEDFIRDDRPYENGLLDYASEDESDGQDALESLHHLITYWKPRCGDIGILPETYSREISRLTGTSLFAEEAEKRYRLFQGNFHLALEKLERLEPLLEIIKNQQHSQSLLATGNLLIWPSNQSDARIEYVNMHADHPSYLRVIVNKAESTLFRKVIGEFRPYSPDNDGFDIPHKFRYVDLSATNEIQASKIWQDYTFEGFGEAKNMEPTISSNPSSKVNSDQTASNLDTGESRIAAWTSKVVSGADPEIAPEVPVEPAQPSRRRVVVDSDDEDDEPPALTATAPTRSKLSTPLDAERGPSKDRVLEDATLVSLVSSGGSTSVVGGIDEIMSADEADHSDLMEVDTRSQLSSHTVLLAEKFPIIPLMPAPSQARQCDSQSASVLESSRGPRAEETFLEESFDELVFPEESGVVSTQSSTYAPASPSTGSTAAGLKSPITTEPLVTLDEWVNEPTAPSTAMPITTPPIPNSHPPTNRHVARPSFDANAYGPPEKRTRGRPGQTGLPRGGNASRANGSNRRGTAHTDYNSRPQPEAESRQTPQRGARLQRGSNLRAFQHDLRQATGRGGRGLPTQSQRNNLIDTHAPASSNRPRVPPGFESYVPLIRPSGSGAWARTDRPNIMDEPVENISPRSSEKIPVDARSESTSGDSRLRFSEEGSEYRVTTIPRRNQTQLRENSLREAMDAIENKKRLDENPPTTHSTMRQQGKNPGKNTNQQETKAQKKERIEKAKLEAHGSIPARQASKQPGKSTARPEQMSNWKRQQMSKNPAIAEAHPHVVKDKVQGEQTMKLISLLEPVFEAARAFNGRLRFEMSVGQVLIAPGPQFADKRLYDVEGWASLFNPNYRPSQSASTFTNILTTNGADIDRALEVKNPVPSVSTRLWSSTPGPSSVSYEFTCQSKSNDEFYVVVDQSGNHELRKGAVTVGTVSIHVPTSIWDASASLSGHLKWVNPPEALVKSADAFVKSLYVVPGKETLMIVFRQPTDHEIKIRNLIVKRVSYHHCNQPGCEDIQLKVVEAKSLLFKVHPQDKNLWQGYEAAKDDYTKHAAEGRIHYEMSLVHKGISRALAANEDLELGELTPEETTGMNLLKRPVIRIILDLALYVVSKIDWMGMHNVGTQRRLDIVAEERNRAIAASLGPAAQSLLHVPTLVPNTIASRYQPASVSHMHGSQSRVAGSMQNQPIPMPVPGVRMNTHAEIVQAADGTLYARGMGGAMVPVPTTAEDALAGSSTIMPDDSASQIDGRAGRVTYHTAGSRLHADRGQGFW